MIDFTRVCDCWLNVGRCRCAYLKDNETNTRTNKGTQSGNQGSEPGETQR